MDAAIIIAAVGVTAAVLTLIKAVFEYTKQNRQKRAEHFSYMRRRLKDNSSFSRICELLEASHTDLRKVSYAEKRDFLGFFQELAILVNSKLMRTEVAHYMFGYYARLCWDSDYFWQNEQLWRINKYERHWSLFADFVRRMKAIERGFRGSEPEIRSIRL